MSAARKTPNQKSSSMSDPSSPPQPARPRPQVLVIDDDPTHRVVICRLAEKIGYVATEAATVAEAAELIRTRRFDCMTLDLHMGAESGVELLEVMNARQAEVPVIVISSADDVERWEVLRVATLYGIRVTEVPKPLKIGLLRDVFMELKLV